MKDGITYLALQFYYPTNSGGLYKNTSDADVIWFRDWTQKNNAKLLLCIFNATNGWDWNLAISAFKNNKTKFIEAIIAEVNRLQFDGVDIDLEGPGANNTEQNTFLAFVTELKTALGNKVLTCETFAGPWHAPNWVWWPDWINKAKIDGIGCMGYDETGANGGTVTYSEELEHCVDPNKFMMGMLGSSSSWAGSGVNTHIDWILNNGQGMGIGIWDANLGSSWQNATIWNKIKTLKQRNATPVVAPVAVKAVSSDRMSITQNGSGGISIALTLQNRKNVKVMVYDVKGSVVSELLSQPQVQGDLNLTWNGSDNAGSRMAPGSYVLAVETNSAVMSKHFMLIK